LLLQAIGQDTQIIYADKMFGTKIEDCVEDIEIWEYPEELAMSEAKAVEYIRSRGGKHDLVFSAYQKKIQVHPGNLLDAAVQNDKSKLM